WTGTGSLTGSGDPASQVVATDDADFTLSDTQLTISGRANMTLSRIFVANLTGGASSNTFNIAGWTGTANVDGGGGSGDTLKLNDPTLTSLTYLATAPHAGTVILNGNNTNKIVFMNLAPVVVTSLVGTTTVTINDSNPHTATFTAAPGARNNPLTIDGGLESLTFTNPTGALVVNGNSAGDTFTFTSLDAGFNAALTVTGGGGADVFNVHVTGSAPISLLGLGGNDTFN